MHCSVLLEEVEERRPPTGPAMIKKQFPDGKGEKKGACIRNHAAGCKLHASMPFHTGEQGNTNRCTAFN